MFLVRGTMAGDHGRSDPLPTPSPPPSPGLHEATRCICILRAATISRPPIACRAQRLEHTRICDGVARRAGAQVVVEEDVLRDLGTSAVLLAHQEEGGRKPPWASGQTPKRCTVSALAPWPPFNATTLRDSERRKLTSSSACCNAAPISKHCACAPPCMCALASTTRLSKRLSQLQCAVPHKGIAELGG